MKKSIKKIIGNSVLVFLGVVIFCSMQMDNAKRVVFFGDSITYFGAVDSAGYINVIRNQMKAAHLDGKYDLIGAGISGNKVYDLYFRLQKDVLDKNPNIVLIYIGINDVWHKTTSGTGTDPDRFNKFYSAIISQLQEKNVRVILCTPSVIGEKYDFTNQQDGDLNAYAQAVRDLAKKFNCDLVDLRQEFLNYEKANNSGNAEKGILTRDRVHLNKAGNELVAGLMYKAIVK